MSRFHCIFSLERVAMPKNSRFRRGRRVGGVSSIEARKKSRKSTVSDAKRYTVLACGSFNPITNMHLRMFEVAKDAIENRYQGCHVASGIISPVSDGYLKKGLESSVHRIKMCSLAVECSNWISVSQWESSLKDWTPTVKVLENIHNSVSASHENSQVMLLCGSDTFESFNIPGLWKVSDVEKIVSDFGLIVLHRPGYDPSKVIEKNKVFREHRDKILVVDDEVINDTSSTSVRKLVRARKSIKYLTPDRVIDYINRNGLYTSIESENKNSDLELAPYQVNRA